MKIVFTGPESSGKTTMAKWASQHYGFGLVNEVARDYLVDIRLEYTQQHVREIGMLQQEAEKDTQIIKKIIICDTDLLTIIVWQLDKYGGYEEDFYLAWQKSKVDLFFLCSPDIPWETDTLRENPTDRARLFDIYKSLLLLNDKPFVVLSGTLEIRLSDIEKNIDLMLI